MSVLAPYVATLASYDVAGEPGVHVGLPSTRLTLVLPVGEPIDVGWAGHAASRRRYRATVSGLHAAPAAIHHGRRQRGVYLELTVAGSRALLGVPAAGLAGAMVEAADLDAGLRDLPDRLAEAPRRDWQPLVETALATALARHDAPGPRAEVQRALDRLAGGARVAAVADEVGFSRRHLRDLVVAETGLSPQEHQRLGRFERSRALVRARMPLAEVAARCGYADQSHLSREWRNLAGCRPTEWQRRELPSVHDAGAVGAAP